MPELAGPSDRLWPLGDFRAEPTQVRCAANTCCMSEQDSSTGNIHREQGSMPMARVVGLRLAVDDVCVKMCRRLPRLVKQLEASVDLSLIGNIQAR